MHKKTKSVVAPRRDLIGATVAAIIAGALAMPVSQSVHAAAANTNATAADDISEVVVTGSRITRRDQEANSPLVSVDSAALEQKSGLNIENYLNQLPEFNPAAAPTVKGGSGGNTDVQISSVNSVGIASVSLRGFGPNRNLVLIDGRRAVPTNALMVVDINSIPSSMIKRVEIISGGASATYGADAIGGVSNFLLRRDFQGLEVDTQWGTTEAGDGDELRASAILGTRFADNRGNIVFASEYYDRKAAYEKNRDFYKDSWNDPTVAGNFLGFVMGEQGYNPNTVGYNVATLNAILANRPAGTGTVGWVNNAANYGTFVTTGTAVGGVRFNPDGSLYVPAGNNAGSFKRPIDGYTYKYVNAYDSSLCNSSNITICPQGPKQIQTVTYDETEGYASSPQTRYAFMGTANYDITDHIRFNTAGRFAQSTTRTFLAGTNASLGWEASIPFNPTVDSPVLPGIDYRVASNVTAAMTNGVVNAAYVNPNFAATGTAAAQHPVSAQMAMLLLSRGAPGSAAQTGTWILETYPYQSFPRRATLNVNNAWEVEAGLKFDLPVKDWVGEVYYSRGESSTYNVAYGNNSLARWRTVVTAKDYGRGLAFQGNGTAATGQVATVNGTVYNVVGTYPGARNFFGTTAAPCTSGFYDFIFKGDATPSDDCLYAVEAALQTRTQNQQDIAELNFQGGLFELPAGEIRTAFGYQHRRNSSQFNPDILQSTASIDDQAIGLYPTGYLDAQTSVNDYYAEALVPVLKDLPFLKKFELEVGGRYSDYTGRDSSTTYKINANIEINDYLRLRGGYNKANRAPNLGELYLNLQQVFVGGGAYGDPCGLLSNAPYGAGGAATNVGPNGTPAVLAAGQTTGGAQSAYLICQAQMGAAGANIFYRDATRNQPVATGGGFAWVNQIGNPRLKNEIADTYTAGVVLRSPFDSSWVRNMSATIDWYQIAINDTILPYSITYAQYLCYGAVSVTNAAEAAAQAQSVACQNNARDLSTGAALNTLLSYDNQATVKTSGIDFALNWSVRPSEIGLDRVPGSFGLNLSGTWLDYYKTKASPAKYDPVIDWKGSLGPNLTGFNAGSYSYRLFTSINWTLPSFSTSIRWRHLPSVAIATKAQEDAIIANNAAVVAGDTSKLLLSYTPTTAYNAKAYDAIDFSGNWTLNEIFSVRFGVDNVFDVDPRTTAATRGYPYDPSLTPAQNSANLAAVCGGAPGCVNPTTYSLGSTGAGGTSGGYYDVLGRRYYVGLKARF